MASVKLPRQDDNSSGQVPRFSDPRPARSLPAQAFGCGGLVRESGQRGERVWMDNRSATTPSYRRSVHAWLPACTWALPYPSPWICFADTVHNNEQQINISTTTSDENQVARVRGKFFLLSSHHQRSLLSVALSRTSVVTSLLVRLVHLQGSCGPRWPSPKK
jgi:hypothetical protein